MFKNQSNVQKIPYVDKCLIKIVHDQGIYDIEKNNKKGQCLSVCVSHPREPCLSVCVCVCPGVGRSRIEEDSSEFSVG